MSEFMEISSKALALAEQSQTFQLDIPERAVLGRDNAHRWTDCVDIESTDRGTNEEKNQQWYELTVRINGEGGVENVGTTISRRFYVNRDVMKDEKRLKLRNREDKQAIMTQLSLAALSSLARALGETDIGSDWWGFGSPIIGRKVWAEIMQRHSKREGREGKYDVEFGRFLPYE